MPSLSSLITNVPAHLITEPVNRAVGEFRELDVFLTALKGIAVRSCAKAHENKRGPIAFATCPLQLRNAACAHWSYPPAETRMLLEAACDFARFSGLITSEEHGVHQSAFLSTDLNFRDLDYYAQQYYGFEHGLRVNSRFPDLDSIRAREVELGQDLLQVRDRLAQVLETLL